MTNIMIGKYGWEGIWYIEVYNKLTGKTTEEVIKNRIMDQALDAMIESLRGIPTDLEIKYMAVGTDDSAIADDQTSLGTEVFRSPPTGGPTKSATGQMETDFVLNDDEANVSIREVAIYVGSAATTVFDSGFMISRILYTKDKTSNETITFRRIDLQRRG